MSVAENKHPLLPLAPLTIPKGDKTMEIRAAFNRYFRWSQEVQAARESRDAQTQAQIEAYGITKDER
jgi:hypothetical protein